MLIGIDEAGMGTLAGPMTAAVVVLADDAQIKGVRDSKTMNNEQREEVAARIMTAALFYQVGSREAEDIDKRGLSKCWLELVRELAIAAKAALSEQLMDKPTNEKIILDGNRLIGLPYVIPVVKADATHLAVSAASILAKYKQVCAMIDAHRLYPAYGFLEHHGYCTINHKTKLRERGPCPIHRRSFRPVRDLTRSSGSGRG